MWNVETTDRFDQWYFEQTTALKEDVLAMMHILAEFGPTLGRPYVDTVKASAYANMKELRIQHAGNPIRAFLLLILTVRQLCSVLETKPVAIKNGFITK
jgi:hypothetical protein